MVVALVGGLVAAVVVGIALVESAHMVEELIHDLTPTLISMVVGLVFFAALIVMLNSM